MLAAVTRTGQLLGLFTADRPTQGVSEIALALGVSKSSAHELAQSLEGIGLLRQGADRRYQLGFGIVHLHRSLMAASDLYDAAAARVRAAHQRTGCAIAVVVAIGGEAGILLAEGGSRGPSPLAAATVTGRSTAPHDRSGVAPIHNEGAVVGVIDVSAAAVGSPGPTTLRAHLAPEHRHRIARVLAAEISQALRGARRKEGLGLNVDYPTDAAGRANLGRATA